MTGRGGGVANGDSSVPRRLDGTKQFGADVRSEACADLARIAQGAVVVYTDEQRAQVDPLRIAIVADGLAVTCGRR